MNTLLLAVATAGIVGLLWKLLFIVLVICILGAVIWAVNTYIAPIPPPILTVLAIVVVILAAIYLLAGTMPMP